MERIPFRRNPEHATIEKTSLKCYFLIDEIFLSSPSQKVVLGVNRSWFVDSGFKKGILERMATCSFLLPALYYNSNPNARAQIALNSNLDVKAVPRGYIFSLQQRTVAMILVGATIARSVAEALKLHIRLLFIKMEITLPPVKTAPI